jgi:hypothetical protein
MRKPVDFGTGTANPTHPSSPSSFLVAMQAPVRRRSHHLTRTTFLVRISKSNPGEHITDRVADILIPVLRR